MALGTILDFGQKAGVNKGDILLAVNGTPVHTYFDAMREFSKQRPGAIQTLQLRRAKGEPFAVSFAVPGRKEPDPINRVIAVAINILTPWLCIAVGFLVAFSRPGNPVAYAFLALLICVSHFITADGDLRYGWEPIFTWTFVGIDALSIRWGLPAWVAFAILFPDPRSKHKLLPWLSWVLSVPLALQGVVFAIYVPILLNLGVGVKWLEPIINIPAWIGISTVASAISLGFANLIYKFVRETQPAMRRRLQWLMFGLGAGMLPICLLLLAASLLKRDLDSFSWWILAPAVITPMFIPLTLAYAVLVDRVFDVGVFIRQGLLAAKTVSVVRAAFTIILIWIAFTAYSRGDLPGWQRAAAVFACILAMIVLRQGAGWLRKWVDRRFFQEAVNTENVLVELSAQVRHISNPQLLLGTVTERLSSALHVPRVVALLPDNIVFRSENAVINRVKNERQPLLLQAEDFSSDELAYFSDLGTELLLPFGTTDKLHGILSMGRKRSEEPYSRSDLRLLDSVANQTGLALENSYLTATIAAEAVHRERLHSELEIARQVQQRLFPKRAPAVNGLDLAGRCQPAQTIGGDYYDFLVTPSGDVGLAIGDVAGKGIPAALLMASLQASLRGLTLAGISDLADLMAKLNLLVYDATPTNRFATFFYGLYNPVSRQLSYSSAGHNPALLYRAHSSQVEWLKTAGLGLGLQRNSQYQQSTVQLEVGDMLVLYTDGVSEARSVDDAEFGDDRLIDIVRSSAKSPAEILDNILTEVTLFAAGAPQHDDITVIVAQTVERNSMPIAPLQSCANN